MQRWHPLPSLFHRPAAPSAPPFALVRLQGPMRHCLAAVAAVWPSQQAGVDSRGVTRAMAVSVHMGLISTLGWVATPALLPHKLCRGTRCSSE